MKEIVTDYIYKKYKIRPEHPWAKYPENATFKDKVSGKWFALIMPVDRKNLGLDGNGTIDVINVKADTEMISFIADTPGFMPAYHMNKRHWLTIFLDGSVSSDQIFTRIDDSYYMVTDSPTKRIYEAVKRIPKCHVATYAQVAKMAGNEKMCRAVGNALHKNPDPDDIPCFRVVNSKGELSGEFAFGGAGAQAKLLIADGVEVIDGKVDLNKFGYVE